jgi:hypothetical protein
MILKKIKAHPRRCARDILCSQKDIHVITVPVFPYDRHDGGHPTERYHTVFSSPSPRVGRFGIVRSERKNQRAKIMSSNQQRVGANTMLAAVLALLSYVPFEWVAKGSLVFAVFLFVVDPFPPVTRLAAMLTVAVVGLLSRIHRRWVASQFPCSCCLQ